MLNGFLKLFNLQKRDTLDQPSAALLDLFRGGLLGGPVSALRSSTATACIRTISEVVGQLPLHVFKRAADGSRERDTTHPVSVLLAGDANPWTGASQLRTQIQADALLNRYGGFAQVIRAGGKVRELHRLLPTYVTPELDVTTGELIFRARSNNGEKVIPYTDVIHIQTPGATIDRPWCCADLAADAIRLDVAMADHQTKLFVNGARPSGILKIKSRIADEAFEAIKESWASAHSGANAGRTAVFENDEIEFQPLQFSSVDMQFIELRNLSIAEIARVFRVPATLIGVLDRATWRNVEQLGQQFLEMCLLPWLEVWQSALDRALFTPEERKVYFTEAVVDDLLRADIAARFAALRDAVGGSWITPNEARRLDNRPPIDGGDDLIRQAGQTPAEPDEDDSAAQPVRLAAA